MTLFCAAPRCWCPRVNTEPFCDWHAMLDRVSGWLIILACALAAFIAAASLMGCGTAGPTKARYVELLHECREANREHLRMLKAYETVDCKSHPEQAAGAVEHGLGGF